ncbi:MAG: amidohydrolase family protein [Eubacteriales bacterium]|nr:amidohydrolase family protein [Eubacteriales bacterium]
MQTEALIHAAILDGTKEMQPQYGRTVLIRDGKIEKIGEDGIDTTGYEVIDLRGAYLMPGMINMHVHLPATGKPQKKQRDVKKLVQTLTRFRLTTEISYKVFRPLLEMELMSGVTTIRTVGGVLNFDSRYREEIKNNTLVGPRVIASNMAVSVPGGHMAGSLAYEATSAAEAAAYADKILDSGADLLKLMITGGVMDAVRRGEPGVLRMPPEYVKAACDRAHRRGAIVAAHVESPEGVRVALENGVDTIEHGAKPDERIMQLFKEKKASVITTISPALPYALFDRSISHATEVQQYNGNIVFEGIIACAKACLEAGVPVGLGTDVGCPYITHYDMWRELYYFHKYCGVSNAFALYSATLGNAEILGLDSEIGSIEEGKMADLLVCAKNPLEDLKVLRSPEMVFAGGERIDIKALKKYPQVEAELDKFVD